MNKPKLFSREPVQMDIKGFLDGLVSNAPEVKEMREALEQAYRDITSKDERIKVLEQNNRRSELSMREWMHVATEMKVQLKVMANTAATCAEQSTNAAISVANQAKDCLQKAEERLARSGMAMVEPAALSTRAGDEGARKIAETFAPRKEDGNL